MLKPPLFSDVINIIGLEYSKGAWSQFATGVINARNRISYTSVFFVFCYFNDVFLEMVRKYILLSQHVGPGLNCLVKISNTIQILSLFNLLRILDCLLVAWWIHREIVYIFFWIIYLSREFHPIQFQKLQSINDFCNFVGRAIGNFLF